jgi:hypothetical protein
VLRDGGERLVVDEVRMLDTAHPGPDGAGDGPAGVGVCRHVAVRRVGLLDDRLDLREGVLRRVDPVGRRGDAAAGHELDVVSTLPELVAGGLPHRHDPVGHAAEPGPGRVVLVGDLSPRAGVPVAASLRERLPGEEDLRATDQPFPCASWMP